MIESSFFLACPPCPKSATTTPYEKKIVLIWTEEWPKRETLDTGDALQSFVRFSFSILFFCLWFFCFWVNSFVRKNVVQTSNTNLSSYSRTIVWWFSSFSVNWCENVDLILDKLSNGRKRNKSPVALFQLFPHTITFWPFSAWCIQGKKLFWNLHNCFNV